MQTHKRKQGGREEKKSKAQLCCRMRKEVKIKKRTQCELYKSAMQGYPFQNGTQCKGLLKVDLTSQEKRRKKEEKPGNYEGN